MSISAIQPLTMQNAEQDKYIKSVGKRKMFFENEQELICQ